MRTFLIFLTLITLVSCKSCFAQESQKDSTCIAQEDLVSNRDNDEFVTEIIFNEFSDENGEPLKIIDKYQLQLQFCKRYYSTLQPSTKRWYNIYKK